jgi:hypothetical protein
MASAAQIAAAENLVAVIEAEWQRDLNGAPEWFRIEGERVLDNAKTLLESIKAGRMADLLKDGNIHGYLGGGWMDTHGKAYDQMELLESLLPGHHAT